MGGEWETEKKRRENHVKRFLHGNSNITSNSRGKETIFERLFYVIIKWPVTTKRGNSNSERSGSWKSKKRGKGGEIDHNVEDYETSSGLIRGTPFNGMGEEGEHD